MDTVQVLLLIAVVVLTFLLLLLGMQVFFILRELRTALRKIGKILDDAGSITENIAAPIANFSSVITGIKTGMSIVNLFKKKKDKKETEETSGERT